MRARLIAVLKWLIALIEAHPDETDAVLERAKVLVQWAEETYQKDAHEAKRHQVLARLIDAFPGARKLTLSRAIDQAVEDVL